MPTIEKASFQELNEMIRKITVRQAQLVTQRAEAAVKQFRTMLKGKGLSFEDVFPHLREFIPFVKAPVSKAPKPATAKATQPAATATKSRAKKKPKAKTKKKLAAKYANPHNSKETWSGHGKRPKWMAQAEKAGVKRESMLIKK